MTTYATNKPVGSMDPKDLFDNAQNLDDALNNITKAIWTDRLGRSRRSYWGMEQAFSAQLLSQQQRFDNFIESSGYKVIGEYTAGPLTVTDYNQLIRYQDEFWKLTGATDIPFTTTGNNAASWTNDSMHFVSVGDAALRQQVSDPAGAIKYPELQMARWRDTGDVRGWGAKGDGVTDNTAAIDAAAAATTSLYLPEGDFVYKGSVITQDRFLTIRGAGLSSTRILYRPSVSGVLFDHTHSPAVRGVMTVSDLTILTDTPSAGTAFKVTAMLTSAPHQVNGQHDAIILNRVHVKQTGSGYWTHFLHAVNSGGNHLMMTSFDNSTTVAQADTSVIGILLEATDARVSMIRSLSATDFYILRTSVAIKTISAGPNPVESFYLHTGEVVGVGKAAYQHVGGVGAIMIVGVHSDVIEKVVDASRGSVLGARYVACDFGCGTNGGASSPSELFAFDYGELVAFSACTFTGIGSETTNPLRYVFSFSNTINGIGLYRFTVDGCVFRNFHHVYGLTNGVQNGVASGNVYAVIYDTICADTFGDTSIVLRDAYVCQTRNLVLTATASQEVTFPLPTKWYPGQLPFAQLVQSSPSGSDNLTVEYRFDASDNTTAKFFIKGCTAARTVRFAFIASALGQSISA
ncbi:glycosyl hydrolase family 28-related protein [Kluyvera cryocrescens]|uniref:glycosyl hydrolase family 28-related protein n=1 Tax=Kluyvera cryocrescens TaxID=580 RepID=UPI0039F4B8C4